MIKLYMDFHHDLFTGLGEPIMFYKRPAICKNYSIIYTNPLVI